MSNNIVHNISRHVLYAYHNTVDAVDHLVEKIPYVRRRREAQRKKTREKLEAKMKRKRVVRGIGSNGEDVLIPYNVPDRHQLYAWSESNVEPEPKSDKVAWVPKGLSLLGVGLATLGSTAMDKYVQMKMAGEFDDPELEYRKTPNLPLGPVPVNDNDNRLADVLFAATLADDAYNHKLEIAKYTNGGYSWLKLRNGQYAGFALYANDLRRFVFSFRGSSSLYDAIADASAFSNGTIYTFGGYKLPIPVTGPSGFIGRIQDLEGQLVKICNDLFYKDDDDEQLCKCIKDSDGVTPPQFAPQYGWKFIITGHSLGGACAEIFAAIFSQFVPPKYINLITFEAARGLSTETADNFEELHRRGVRISNSRDPVPNLPFEQSGYKHIGDSWYLDLAKHPEVFADSFEKSVNTHSMGSVKKALERYINAFVRTSGRGKISQKRKKKTTERDWMKFLLQ